MKHIENKIDLEDFISKNWNEINQYINEKMKGLPIPIYCSTDIRESNEKFAPIDHNMYPAGFNNLCTYDLNHCTDVFSKILKERDSKTKNIAIIVESHTKNKFYLDNIAILNKIIRDAGFNSTLISFDEKLFDDNQKSIKIISHSKYEVEIHKAEIKDDFINANNKNIDLTILNNDQSNPIKQNFQSIETIVIPSPKLGWHYREKAKFFKHYKEVIDNFSDKFSINKNLLQAKYKSIYNIDFSNKEGLDYLAKNVDHLINNIGKDSKVFVKANKGTYGMGIIVVKSGEEIIHMNRKTRNKMDIGKNKIKFNSVLIQEGIETCLKYNNDPAEVTIYLIGGKSVGGFMRTNSKKTSNSNLNSQGMIFRKYCISEIRENNDHQSKEATYSVIARLATLASGYETLEIEKLK